jgi:hypothetical protein
MYFSGQLEKEIRKEEIERQGEARRKRREYISDL